MWHRLVVVLVSCVSGAPVTTIDLFMSSHSQWSDCLFSVCCHIVLAISPLEVEASLASFVDGLH